MFAWPTLVTFVFGYLTLDLFTMAANIGPGVSEVLGSRRGIGSEQVGFAGTEPSGLL